MEYEAKWMKHKILKIRLKILGCWLACLDYLLKATEYKMACIADDVRKMHG